MGVIRRIQAFWAKFGNDWGMNLAGLLAYNFLTAIFPLLLGILALAAFIAPASVIEQLASKMNTALPASLTSGANINFYTILQGFRKASGITLIVSLVGLLWTGSNLFGVMENCFSIVFRTKTRGFIQQKLMSIIMIIIFAILAPLAVVASSIVGSVSALVHAFGNIPGLGLLFAIGGYAVGVLIAFVLFFCIYLIVPHMKINPRDAWRGALFAAILFEIVTLVFPFYVRMQHAQFGSFVLLLAILTFWFWVISLILLLGAEMNSFAALGQRAAGGDLPTLLHDSQVHGHIPREGEDADAPPAGHPVSRQGERVHARERQDKGQTSDQEGKGQTSEDVAHAPSDAHRGSGSDRAKADRGRTTAASLATPKQPAGSRFGGALLAALAGLLALLSVVRHGNQAGAR
jgi:membrane protein